MKRILTWAGVFAVLLGLGGSAWAKEHKPKPGPMTGTWECMSHGGPQGDMAFTLSLEQNRENVSGSVSSPIGNTDISSGTFKNKMLEIHIDTPEANYVLTGKLKKGELTGEWSGGNQEKGSWEGKKKTEPKQ